MSSLEKFKKIVAQSENIPPDLEMLVLCTLEEKESPFEEIVLSALLPGEENEINDISYLSKEELNDPDIQSNIEAIKEVANLARFVAKDGERNLFGYWLGKDNLPLDQSPIVKFDNEGQFSILPGKTLTEAVCGDYAADDDDTFKDLKNAFKALKINFVAKNCDDLYGLMPELEDAPDALHKAFYSAHRQKRGLKSVE